MPSILTLLIDQPESSAGSAAPTQTKPPATSQSLITSQISTSGFGGPSSSSTSPSSKSVNVGAIVGGVVGGIAGLTAIVVLILFLMRKRRAPVMVTPARPPLPEKAGGLQSYDSTIKKNNSQSRRQVAFQSRRGLSRQRSTVRVLRIDMSKCFLIIYSTAWVGHYVQ